jgi:hypothetical protein
VWLEILGMMALLGPLAQLAYLEQQGPRGLRAQMEPLVPLELSESLVQRVLLALTALPEPQV